MVAMLLVGLALAAGGGATGAAPATTDPNRPPTNAGPAGIWPKTVQGDIHRAFTSAGPHRVARSQHLHPCGEDFYGAVQKFAFWLAGGNDSEKLRCTSAFPHGLSSPIGMMYYYPTNLTTARPAPVLVWMPGLDGDAGQYDQIAKLWASRGFVVAIPYNFINSFPTDDIWGIQAVLSEASRRGSALYRKIDFGKTILGGHSGGAGATFWGASYLPKNARLLSPKLKIIGALSVGTGIQAPTGLGVTVPMLTITGNLDFITPDFLWPRWIDHKTIFQAPAYIATAINGSHFAVNSEINNNPVAGLSMAWLEHLVGNNPGADKVFVGRHWTLPKDASFIAVERNALADRLR